MSLEGDGEEVITQVLFRYNLLVVLLCVTMNRPYQFYSFVPLVSFWYLMVFVTMWLPPRVHASRINDSSAFFHFVSLHHCLQAVR